MINFNNDFPKSDWYRRIKFKMERSGTASFGMYNFSPFDLNNRGEKTVYLSIDLYSQSCPGTLIRRIFTAHMQCATLSGRFDTRLRMRFVGVAARIAGRGIGQSALRNLRSMEMIERARRDFDLK